MGHPTSFPLARRGATSDAVRVLRAAEPPIRRLWCAGLALAALGFASGCTLHTDYAATGTAPATASHLWVTVSEIWLSTAADTLPESSSGWVKNTLPTPITLDLAALTPGDLAALVTGVSISAGTYVQVHLVTADSADALTASAQTAGLANNSQITVTAADGTTTTAPLESPVPEGGLTIAANISLAESLSTSSLNTSASTASTTSATDTTATTVSTNTTDSTTSASSTPDTVLAVTVDAARDVLSYTYGTTTGYILSPIMSVADESKSGGISGSIDATGLVAGHGPVYVSAEIPDATGTHHAIVQRAVVGSGGSFVLYPLPAPSTGSTDYDLVITCANAETMIVQSIPVSQTAVSGAVVVQTTPIYLTAATPAYADQSATAAVLPGGARVDFYQTLPASGELPYLIDGTAVDPVSHRLPADAFALGTGVLQVGPYASGATITFAATAPLEGVGGFLVGSEGLYRADTLTTAAAIVTGTSVAPTQVFAPRPLLPTGAVPGTLSLTITAPSGHYDSGFVVVSAGNRVVETTGIASLLAAAGGNVNITNLPAGSALAASGGVPYQVAVRAWNSGDPAASFVRVAATTSVPLGDGGTGSVTLNLP
jgi:hypothetical protein